MGALTPALPTCAVPLESPALCSPPVDPPEDAVSPSLATRAVMAAHSAIALRVISFSCRFEVT
jgi:hypothetical protein